MQNEQEFPSLFQREESSSILNFSSVQEGRTIQHNACLEEEDAEGVERICLCFFCLFLCVHTDCRKTFMDHAASFSRLSLQPTDQEHVLKEASDVSPNTHLQLREQEWLLEEVPEAGSLGFGGGGGGAEVVGSFGSEVKLFQNLEKCILSKTQKLQEDHICQICKRGVHGQEEQPEGNCMELQAVVAREFSNHEPGVARLNNGSFGSPPQCVLSNQAMWAQQWLQHPDAFCWEPLEKGLAAARQQLADLIHSPSVNEIVLLENATTGAGVVALDVMWSFLERRYEKGDSILMFNSAYGAIKKVFQVKSTSSSSSSSPPTLNL